MDLIEIAANLAGNAIAKSVNKSDAPELGKLSDRPKKDKASVFESIADETDNSSLGDQPTPSVTKPKMLSFGDGLAHGLPESWSIVPPDSGVIRKPHVSKKVP